MMTDFLRGAVSGLVATAPMTRIIVWGHQQLPWYERYPLPPRQITMRAANRLGILDRLSRGENRMLTLLAHYLYGAAMGAILGTSSGNHACGPLRGAMFSLFVWAGSYLGLLPALGMLSRATVHPPRRNALMIGSHLVWGAVAGLLLQQLRTKDAK